MGKNTIKVRKFTNIQDEYVAEGAIIPGALVELTSNNKVKNHSVAAGKHSFMFAIEDEMQGKDINGAYAIGDRVQVGVFGRGDIVNALLEDEANVAVGAYLESNGEGKLQAYTNGVIVGIALEAKDLSSYPEGSESSVKGAYYNPRILVQLV